MPDLTTGKIAEVMFSKALETFEDQDMFLPLVEFEEPSAETMQNTSNVIWYPVEQHAPVIEGWDLTGQEQGIIEETYPAVLGIPKNDFVQQRADDMRTLRFWERRGQQSGRQQSTELNRLIAQSIEQQGSLYYKSAVTSGFDFIAEAQALMNERQLYKSQRYFCLNDRDNLKFAKDLASRETIKGRPADTWKSGQIGSNVAEFDIFVSSNLGAVTYKDELGLLVSGDQSFKPEAGSVDSVTKVVTNIDYREALIPLTTAESNLFNIGDKVRLYEPGVYVVRAISLADKLDTGQQMTFTIVGLPDASTVKIYPKPIALDDVLLSDTEKAYANVNTTILDGATIQRLDTELSLNKYNIFWDKSAVKVIGGSIPASQFSDFAGKKVISDTMSNGLKMYMVYDGKIDDMTFRYRLFTWYGITVCNPSNCGVAISA